MTRMAFKTAGRNTGQREKAELEVEVEVEGTAEGEVEKQGEGGGSRALLIPLTVNSNKLSYRYSANMFTLRNKREGRRVMSGEERVGRKRLERGRERGGQGI